MDPLGIVFNFLCNFFFMIRNVDNLNLNIKIVESGAKDDLDILRGNNLVYHCASL